MLIIRTYVLKVNMINTRICLYGIILPDNFFRKGILMRIQLIRHADPNYEIDSLTETGFKEAKLLAEYLKDKELGDCFVSPLGRAKDTARPTLEITGKSAKEFDWLREFSDRLILRPDMNGGRNIPWDWLPQDWTKSEEFYRRDEWFNQPVMAEADIESCAKEVTDNFDKLLAQYGYVREGNYYRVEDSNDKTITLFCHYGVGCVLIGHLIGVSPMVLWHGFAAAPTSITTIYTEERRKGIASFRVWSYGETPHLTLHNEPKSFSARFCECYDFEHERHD